MSQKSLEHIRAAFGPTQYLFGVDEVAALLGKQTDAEKDYVRVQMRRGDIPGARKDGKSWKIPIDDLADLLDGHPVQRAPPIIPLSTSRPMSRRRSLLGERLGDIRAHGFWSRVAEALGWAQEAQLLDQGAMDIINELRREWALKNTARFDASFAPASAPARGRGPGNTL
ncbi:helix-turn-helix domain-containing protein [Bacillus sp. NP157]|nr:helix-turn-helix domain-containing protein [Bacillus sp. NP157]